jgi:uncharacterized BrkB/YihY/UPF0761 family membrane protein
MNPVERVIRRADRWQQRHTVPAFIVGVIKKFGDDNGGVLVNNLSHASFIALFPLLLVGWTILAELAAGDKALRDAVMKAIQHQFPKPIGDLLPIHVLPHTSLAGLILGLLLLTWGATGLAQAGLFTMTQVWNIPGPARPGYVQRLGRSALFLLVLGGGVILTTGLTSLGQFGNHLAGLVMLAQALAVLANLGLYFVTFRVLTPKGVPSRALVPGSVVGGLGYSILQVLGLLIVNHYLHSASVYGVFGTVLGLIAWIYIVVNVTVYAAEINVVLARRLWPRSIVQPPLTEADRASIALQALQNQRRPEEDVSVTFTDRADGETPAYGLAPRTPDEVAPPAEHRDRGRA